MYYTLIPLSVVRHDLEHGFCLFALRCNDDQTHLAVDGEQRLIDDDASSGMSSLPVCIRADRKRPTPGTCP